MTEDSFHNFHLDGGAEPYRDVAVAGIPVPSIAAACLDGCVGAGAASSLLLLLLTLSASFGSWLPIAWLVGFLFLDFTARFLAIRHFGKSVGEFVAASEATREGATPARVAFLGMAGLLPLRLVGLMGERRQPADSPDQEP